MTSLYDQYHSNKNIDHMYNLINDLIEKQGGISIKSDLEFKKYYENKLREIFIESDSDNLVDLNRELLRHHIIYYKNKENTNANNHMLSIPKTEIEDTKKDNNDVTNQFNEYLKMRDLPKMKPRITEENNGVPNNGVPNNGLQNSEVSFDDMMNDMKGVIEQPKLLETIIESNETIEENINIITSANRKDIQSNRFDYTVLCDTKLNKFEKLIIPIENSIHFALPMLKLIIDELDINMNIYLKETHILNNYTYGEYIANNHKINKKSDILNIKIQSIYDDSEYNHDIVEGKLNDDNEGIVLKDCEDFKINDIVSINSKEFIKIIDIKDNTLILESLLKETLEKDEKIYIMNMNLQNTLVFY